MPTTRLVLLAAVATLAMPFAYPLAASAQPFAARALFTDLVVSPGDGSGTGVPGAPGSAAPSAVTLPAKEQPYVFRPRARLSLEVQPGVAFPFRSFIDYKSSGATLRVDTPYGFNIGLNLLLNQFELRWSATWLTPCAGCFTINSPQLDGVAEAIRAATGGAVNLNTRPSAVDGSLVLHQLTGGYRYYLLSGAVRPFIPLAAGLGIATSPAALVSRPLFGFTFLTGVGVDFELNDHFILGLGVRINFLVTEPERNFALVDIVSNEGKALYDQPVAYTFFLSTSLQLRGRF